MCASSGSHACSLEASSYRCRRSLKKLKPVGPSRHVRCGWSIRMSLAYDLRTGLEPRPVLIRYEKLAGVAPGESVVSTCWRYALLIRL